MFDLTKPLQTRDGLCTMRFLGHRKARDGRTLVFAKQENHSPHHEMIVTRFENGQSMRDLASRADVVNKVVRVTRYMLVTASGRDMEETRVTSFGTEEGLRDRAARLGLNVKGIMRLTFEDGVLVSSGVVR